jgi:hypothetical protein
MQSPSLYRGFVAGISCCGRPEAEFVRVTPSSEKIVLIAESSVVFAKGARSPCKRRFQQWMARVNGENARARRPHPELLANDEALEHRCLFRAISGEYFRVRRRGLKTSPELISKVCFEGSPSWISIRANGILPMACKR